MTDLQKHRLNSLTKEYSILSKELKDLLYKIFRIRNEIEDLCNKLNITIDLEPMEPDENTRK